MLRDLLRLGDAFFSQMVDNFLSEGPRRIERLHETLEKGELEDLAITAHGLASVAGTVAAVDLTGLCHQLEKMARQHPPVDCRPALRQVEEGFVLAAGELRRIVADRDSRSRLGVALSE